MNVQIEEYSVEVLLFLGTVIALIIVLLPDLVMWLPRLACGG